MFRQAKILLVNPWIHDFTAFDLWAKPLGLLAIGRLLAGAGLDVSMLDLTDSVPKRRADGSGQYSHELLPLPRPLKGILSHRRFKRYGLHYTEAAHRANAERKPDLVLLTSSMTYWYTGVRETVEFLRRAYGNVEIWAGGTYVELMPEHAAEKLQVSRLLRGLSAEEVARQVFDYLMVKPSARWSDSASLDIFHPYTNEHCYALRTSYGCPMRCSYCGSMKIHGDYRPLPARQVAGDIAKALRRGIRNITFYDDALLAGRAGHLTHVMEELQRQLPPSLRPGSGTSRPAAFHVPNGLHGRNISQECADLLAKWNFGTINIGYEFDDQERQDSTGGKIFRDELEEAIGNLRRAGFGAERIRAYLLCGYPGARLEDLLDAISAAVAAGARPSLALFTPVPGSQDYEERFRNTEVNSEPLLANKNIFLIRSGFCSEEEYAALRITIQKLEKELLTQGSVPGSPARDVFEQELSRVRERFKVQKKETRGTARRMARLADIPREG